LDVCLSLNRQTLGEIVESVIPTRERIEALAELARGIYVEREIRNPKTGETYSRVYSKPPDVAAIKELNDRQYGKVPAMTTGDGPNGMGVRNLRPISVNVTITDAD